MHPDPYLRLMRLDRPVGTLLLLWPTLTALWLAAGRLPPVSLLVVFVIGTLLMRSAGCVINDIADRNVDPHVQRTRHRPLATGAVSLRQAIGLFVLLCVAAAALLLFLNQQARMLAVAGLGIAALYPFLKRWTHYPQLALGVAFSWGILMAFAAVAGRIPAAGWLMFAASAAWIVAYDTLYAMTDRADDLKVGVKSTAIRFGRFDRLAVGALQAGTLAGLSALGLFYPFGIWYLAGMVAMAGLFAYQQVLIRERQPAACFKAFLNNTWVGFSLFAAVVMELSVWPGFSGG